MTTPFTADNRKARTSGDNTENGKAYRATSYATSFRLLDYLLKRQPELFTGLWVDPCAGNGAIVKHVTTFLEMNACPGPWQWTTVDCRSDTGIREHLDWMLPRIDCHEATALQDFKTSTPAKVCITNLPWYGWTQQGLVERMRELWPSAHIFALTDVREFLDGPIDPATGRQQRAQWFKDHTPTRWLQLPGRQRFSDAKAGYPHPVAWLHWAPHTINESFARMEML